MLSRDPSPGRGPLPGVVRRLGRVRSLAAARARRGSVALMVAIAAVPLLLAVGLAVDLTRLYVLRSRLVSATDAAALAGARAMFDSDRNAQVESWFWANFTRRAAGGKVGYLGSTVTRLDITPDNANRVLTVSATATLPTTFMRLASAFPRSVGAAGDFDTMTTRANQSARRQDRGMELALVLDVTGSMEGDRMNAMRTAAVEMVDSLYGGNDTVPNLWVSVVPYVASVNIGQNHSDWLATGVLHQNDYAPAAHPWLGCVEARHENRQDETDTPPGDVPFRPYLWRSTFRAGLAGAKPGDIGDNGWTATNVTEPNVAAKPAGKDTFAAENPRGNNTVGPNLACPRAILPLTRERTVVRDEIRSLFSMHRGGTMANLGLQMGWATLSPRWRRAWGSATSPLDYRTPFMDKVLVLMTDGENLWNDLNSNTNKPDVPVACTSTGPNRDAACNDGWKMRADADYTAYGRLSENRLGLSSNTNTNANAEINARMSRLCTNIKSAGITVYTITFGVGSTGTQTLYRSCASRPDYYFNSPDSTALRAAFREITQQLANLRLVR